MSNEKRQQVKEILTPLIEAGGGPTAWGRTVGVGYRTVFNYLRGYSTPSLPVLLAMKQAGNDNATAAREIAGLLWADVLEVIK